MAIKDEVYNYEKEILNTDDTVKITFEDTTEKIKIDTNNLQIVKKGLDDGKNIYFNEVDNKLEISSAFKGIKLVDITPTFEIKPYQESSYKGIKITFPTEIDENQMVKITVGIIGGYSFQFEYIKRWTNDSHYNLLSLLLKHFKSETYNLNVWPEGNNIVLWCGTDDKEITLNPKEVKIYNYESI